MNIIIINIFINIFIVIINIIINIVTIIVAIILVCDGFREPFYLPMMTTACAAWMRNCSSASGLACRFNTSTSFFKGGVNLSRASTGESRASLRAAASSGVASAATVAPLEHAVSAVNLDKSAAASTPSSKRGEPSPRLRRRNRQK